jgi:hypothetical protein
MPRLDERVQSTGQIFIGYEEVVRAPTRKQEETDPSLCDRVRNSSDPSYRIETEWPDGPQVSEIIEHFDPLGYCGVLANNGHLILGTNNSQEMTRCPGGNL